jgi:hypothetical protein
VRDRKFSTDLLGFPIVSTAFGDILLLPARKRDCVRDWARFQIQTVVYSRRFNQACSPDSSVGGSGALLRTTRIFEEIGT